MMRTFSSYGPVDRDLHYYVPRQALVDRAYSQLLGEDPDKGGHYITVWAPRQRGKTWVMQQVVGRLKERGDFEVALLTMQSAQNVTTAEEVLALLVRNLRNWFARDFPTVTAWADLGDLFSAAHFSKPTILILDEFDALGEDHINAFANEFRNLYLQRSNQADRVSGEKSCLLHGLALVGVRSVLGIESITGSPFNVQQSLHIPNLTFEEVESMFRWYERESGQKVEPAAIERLFYETQGQPGLVSWFGELLTETYNEAQEQPLTLAYFEGVYAKALHVLPNNNVLNIISKAKQMPYRDLVLELFRTHDTVPFRYDDPQMNFLYLNGVIDWEDAAPDRQVAKFPCPFVQKRLFNYFAHTLFRGLNRLYAPFEDLSDTVTEDSLDLENLLRRYGDYLRANRDWLFKDVPRRADLRPYEAVYHFGLYVYLQEFIRHRDGQVWPEFPTGNGKVDLLVKYAGRVYGLEVKSYVDAYEYHKALRQAARYGRQLGLTKMTLAFFVEAIDEANRARYEAVYEDGATGVTVTPVFVATGG